MSDKDLYKELGSLTRDKSKWRENIPYLISLLDHGSSKIQAKALWFLGEAGLMHPSDIGAAVPKIIPFCESDTALLRERSVNALGRIGRADLKLIENYWPGLFRLASDEDPKVRLSFIWASENIATNTPDIYRDHMPVFEKLLLDPAVKVRMEAPEIFRVLGKRRPEFVRPYLDKLQKLSETDPDPVVRIHCSGAVRATLSK